MTDAGMCGDYEFGDRHGEEPCPSSASPASCRPSAWRRPTGPATLCGLFVETDDRTGLARRALPFREGGVLAADAPER